MTITESDIAARKGHAAHIARIARIADQLPVGHEIRSGQNIFLKVDVAGDIFWQHNTVRGNYKGHLTTRQMVTEAGSKAVEVAASL